MKICKRITAWLVCVLLAGMFLRICIPVTAFAQAVPEEGRLGSIMITMRYNGHPLPGGELTLYQVGKVDGWDGDYWFCATEKYVKWDDDFRNLENADVDDLAAQLAQFVEEEKIIGAHETVDPNGKALFDNDGPGLKQGLYLVVQNVPAKGFQAISPFLVSLPYYDGEEYIYDVTAVAKNELEQTPETKPPGSSNPPTSNKPSPKLPQTGQLNWPVPVMAILGMTLFAVGWVLRFRKRDDNAQ